MLPPPVFVPTDLMTAIQSVINSSEEFDSRMNLHDDETVNYVVTAGEEHTRPALKRYTRQANHKIGSSWNKDKSKTRAKCEHDLNSSPASLASSANGGVLVAPEDGSDPFARSRLGTTFGSRAQDERPSWRLGYTAYDLEKLELELPSPMFSYSPRARTSSLAANSRPGSTSSVSSSFRDAQYFGSGLRIAGLGRESVSSRSIHMPSPKSPVNGRRAFEDTSREWVADLEGSLSSESIGRDGVPLLQRRTRSRWFDPSSPARISIETTSWTVREAVDTECTGTTRRMSWVETGPVDDVTVLPVDKPSAPGRRWGLNFVKAGVPRRPTTAPSRPALMAWSGAREEAGVGICTGMERATLEPCGVRNASGSHVVTTGLPLPLHSEIHFKPSMLSRSGSESAARRGPPRPPPSRPVPATPLEFALPDENGRQRESTVRQHHAGSSSSGPSPRSSAAYAPSSATSLSSAQRPSSGADHARFVKDMMYKNGNGNGHGELLAPYESTANYSGPYRDSLTTDDSGSLPSDDEDHARAYEYTTTEFPPGTATTSDDVRVASHRPHASMSSRAPIAESNTRWSAARSRSGSTASINGWRGLNVNTATYSPGDQDEYGLPSPESSPPDPDGLMSHGEYGGIVGPRRDLYSDDELESVIEENETESLTSDDDLAADREDRTAAMIIAEEGRGLIIDAKELPVSQLDVQEGATHLLLPNNPTPDQLLPFLSTILPQISTTLLCLDISANHLTSLPPALAACINLEELNVSSNPLRSLPSTVGTLINLRVLIADACELTSLPSQLANLAALHSLSVRRNRLVMLPIWMHTMTALETLKLEGNAFAGPWRGVVDPLMPRSVTTPVSSAGSRTGGLMPETPGSALASPGGQYLNAPLRSAVWPSSAVSANIESAVGDKTVMPNRSPNGLAVNGLYGAARAANSYPMLVPNSLESPIALAGGGVQPRNQVQRSYSQQPVSGPAMAGATSPYLGGRPLTVQSPPPQTTAAVLNMHLGALAPSAGGVGRKKKKKRGGSISGSEGLTMTDGESEYDGATTSWRSREEAEHVADVDPNGWAARAGPRRMKSADELRRMGPPVTGTPMGLGLEGHEDIHPPTENHEELAQEELGSQMKRYVSLGVRSSPGRPDARTMWGSTRQRGVGVGQRNSAGGQRNSDIGPMPGQRNSAVGPGQRASAVGLQGQTLDEDEVSPDVSFEESKHDPSVPSSPEERRKGRWGFLKKVSMGRLRSHSNADRLGRLPPAELRGMPGMPARRRGDSPMSSNKNPISPPQPIAMAAAPPPRVDVTSAGSPASSVLTARMLQPNQSREAVSGQRETSASPGGLYPPISTTSRAKRRSFLPFDNPPTLNIPIPSAEPFIPGVIALGEPEGEETPEEAQRRVDDEAARSHAALRGVMNYLRDMADLGAGSSGVSAAVGGAGPTRNGSGRRPPLSTYADGRTMSDGSFASSSASNTPALRSAPSTASLRGGQDSVNTTDSSGSYGHGFAEDRKYKDDKGKRAGIVKEIIETEKSYVRGLQELVDIYVKPASEPAPGLNVSKETTIPAPERKIVFTGVDALLQFHKQSFLPSLIKASAMLHTGAEDTNGQISTMAAHAVANVFVTHAAFMKMYFTYINNFDNAIQRLQYWVTPPSTPNTPGNVTPATTTNSTVGIGISMVAMGVTGMTPDQPQHSATLNAGQRKRIKTFLKRTRLNPRHSQLNLEGYLLLPIQRIPRYKMLLDNLVTCTPPRPEATDDPLERALEEIAVLASSMNEGKRESESRSKLVQWQSRIRGKFISPLVQPHRRLIMDGRLNLVRLVKKVNNRADVSNPDGTLGQIELPCLSSDSNPKQLVAILCNDLLVLCKEPPVMEANSQVELWAVLRMQTMAQPASIVSGNGLRIVDNKAILYFNTQSTSEALTWQRAINLHIPHSQ